MDHDHLHSHTGILTDSSQSEDEEENAHSHLLVNCDDQEEFSGNESDGCRPEEDSTENAVVERLIMIKERHRLLEEQLFRACLVVHSACSCPADKVVWKGSQHYHGSLRVNAQYRSRTAAESQSI